MAPGPPTRRGAPRARRAPPAAVPALLLLALALAGCTAPAPSPDGGASPGGHGGHVTGPLAPSALDRSVDGLPASQPMGEARLEPGAPFALAAAPVAHDPGLGHPIRMFAYNGQLPGPVLRAAQGARVEVAFTNHLPVPTTVHWHGIRLAPEHDGVPGLSQDPVPPGGSFRYVLDLPDEGAYWYHAHVREDLQQELGLAGLLLVEGPDHGEGPREVPLVLDDLLVQGRDVAPFGEAANRALMGRYGNLLMANGGSSWQGEAQPGERVRLVLVNAANARPLRLWLDGAAKAEWVGIDGGFFDAPRPWPGALVLAPAERAVVDVVMPASRALW